jgi:Xaa-Pro aminopeptidase
MTEIQISEELLKFGKSKGASGYSFEAIVASGPNSAIPHHRPTTRKIKNNEFIKLDFGFIYNGYCSDMTRTIQVGNADHKLIEAYDAVLEAHMAVIKNGKIGMSCFEIEEIARDVLRDHGLDQYMTHSLGHGLGIEVHEAPFFSRDRDYKPEVGEIFTNEPGVYLPGIGGVRIEDDLLVTSSGFKPLNKSNKKLITIKGK